MSPIAVVTETVNAIREVDEYISLQYSTYAGQGQQGFLSVTVKIHKASKRQWTKPQIDQTLPELTTQKLKISRGALLLAFRVVNIEDCNTREA